MLIAGCASSDPPEDPGPGRTGPFATFAHRRLIELSPDTPADYPIAFALDHAALVEAGHALPDGSDFQLAYEDQPIDRVLETSTTWDSASTVVWFRTQGDGAHYVYYGDPTPEPPLEDPTVVFDFWDGFDGDEIDASWTLHTIGGATGEARLEEGAARVSGATGSLGGTVDDMVFFARELSGGFVVDVSLRSAGGSLGAEARAGGIMARQSPLPDARFVTITLQDTPRARVTGFRPVDATDAELTPVPTSAEFPLLFSMRRTGTVFELLYSEDAITWVVLATEDVAMMDPVLVGVPLANISAGSGVTETDYFRMRRSVVPAPTATPGTEETL